jgi:1-acyl-sn-glycerol-3-phosphate acyltransferase
MTTVPLGTPLTTMSATMSERAGFAFRWLVTMFCFAVFGLGGLVFGAVLVPLVTLATPSRPVRVQRLRWWLCVTFRGFVRLMSGLRGASFEVIGTPPRDGNYLIVANHPTLFDAVVLLALFPQADCIVKHELAHNPFMRFALSGLDYISNADTAGMLACAIERLQSGRSLLVFPEGTRSRPGEPVQFHLAAATVAARAGVPCLPVVIRCDPPATSKQARWFEIAPQRPHHSVTIEPPMDVGPVVHGLSRRYAKRALNRFLQAYYNQQLSCPRAAPAHLSSISGLHSLRGGVRPRPRGRSMDAMKRS